MPNTLLARARTWLGGPTRQLGTGLLGRADAARDAGRTLAAACLYEEAAAILPDRPGIHIQSGHMFKESGLLDRAEQHYLVARRLAPRDADLWLQLGHFYKVGGKLDESAAAYRQALALRPGWEEAARELGVLRQTWGGGRDGPADALPVGRELIDPRVRDDLLRFDAEAGELAASSHGGRLAPMLVPRAPHDLLQSYRERIEVSRLGQREASHWGVRPTLRGVTAIRGFCISATPVLEVQVFLNGLTVHRGPMSGAWSLRLDLEPGLKKKYVFNVWLDLSRFGPGLYALELRFVDTGDTIRSVHEQIVIAPPLSPADYPDADGLVTVDADDPRPLEEQIRAQPSVVRPAARALFPDGVRNVLVLRTDQLGDMIASIPAMLRLRALVPEARIVGLLTAANAAFAETLDLFDEVIVVDFPDDPVEQRRIMPLAAQEALRRRLEPYRFDIALDLAQSSVSRDLLQVSGARFIYGVGGGDWPYLTGEFIFNTHDRWTRMDVVPHSGKVLAMIEALGAVLKTSAPVIPRTDLTRALLADYGIGPDDRYVLLHAGARVVFSRWPHYPELARLLLARGDLKVVMMSEDAGIRATLPPDLLASDRFLFLDQRLPFDHFDAFISFAAAMVGNDSGPKHLASLRGTNVVTLFTARINWTEWGQENVGAIITRRVPCAGCAIFHDLEDCGQDFTCIRGIAPHEVLTALEAYL